MISVKDLDVLTNTKYRFVLFGLSTDAPTPRYIGISEDIAIANGSIFYEIDTAKVYIYDEANDRWYSDDGETQRMSNIVGSAVVGTALVA